MKFKNLLYLFAIAIPLLMISCADDPTCFDGIQNQGETGVDCTANCNSNIICICCDSLGIISANCFDGIQNGSEEGIDCGGPDCNACVNTANCSDGIMNQNEEGIDCGGSCPPCQTGGGDFCTTGANPVNSFVYTVDGAAANDDIIGTLINTGGGLSIKINDLTNITELNFSIPSSEFSTGTIMTNAINLVEFVTDVQTANAQTYNSIPVASSGSITFTSFENTATCKYVTGSFNVVLADASGATKELVGTFVEIDW